MIIQFSIENYLSFKSQNILSMVSTPLREDATLTENVQIPVAAGIYPALFLNIKIFEYAFTPYGFSEIYDPFFERACGISGYISRCISPSRSSSFRC